MVDFDDVTLLADPSRFRSTEGGSRVKWRAYIAALVMGVALSGCVTPPPPPPPPVAEAPPPPELLPPPRFDRPDYFRLRNTAEDRTPVRVALLLPFSNPSPETRGLANAMLRAAEMALFDSDNRDLLLMPRDDGGSPERAVQAARQAINDGAEIILGPLFAQSAIAVGPIARAENVPVIAFSSDRNAGGNGVFLLSFQPETEVERIVSYAARSGHSSFAAMVPQTAYGDKVADQFRATVSAEGGAVAAIERFAPQPGMVGPPADRVAASFPDAILLAEGGVMLQTLGPALALRGANSPAVRFLGTGLWDDPAVTNEPMLQAGWFAAPSPNGWQDFSARYRRTHGRTPPRLASLSYDAVSLVSVLSNGIPYRRFTDAALTDPNGFAGVDGIFRFRIDGGADRGLAVLQVGQNGFSIVDPAPASFIPPGF
jgi:ABC-type branched-subunit amino acid transport system substrate-binding protein